MIMQLFFTKHIQTIALVLSFVLISPIWVETDIYRYAALLLVLGSLYKFHKSNEKPRLPWMGILCYLWPAYVFLFYLLINYTKPDAMGGSAEGIYLFTALYPTIGYFFFLNKNMFMKVIWIFQVVSFVLLLVSIQPIAVLMSPIGTRINILFHNNAIHASLGTAIILITSIFFMVWQSQQQRYRTIGLTVSIANILLSVVGIFGASSKGIWISLIGLAAFCVCYAFWFQKNKVIKAVLVAIVLLAGLFSYVLISRGLDKYILDNIQGFVNFLTQLTAINDFTFENLSAAISQTDLPKGMSVRLNLWIGALRIWLENPIFGVGIYWENLWEGVLGANSEQKLVHNGFLSVAMRFGVVGIIFYGTLFGWTIKQVRKCADLGVIHKLIYYCIACLLLLFLFSLLTNSNHRLAIGEAFMLVLVSFGFYCNYMNQWHSRAAVKK